MSHVISISITNPDGSEWSQDVVDNIASIGGASDVAKMPEQPSTIVCSACGDTAAARRVVNAIAKMLPGVAVKWGSALP